MRVLYYGWMGYQPNMPPGIAFFFLPMLLFMLLAVALPIEAALRWFITFIGLALTFGKTRECGAAELEKRIAEDDAILTT